MKVIFRRWLDKSKRRILRRLDKTKDTMAFKPQFLRRNIQYEGFLRKTGADLRCGGIGSIAHADQASWLGRGHRSTAAPVENITCAYQDSDHVLNIAYIPLCSTGLVLQDLELLRNDENYLNALGTRRIPDPTTAGDFCRRFTPGPLYIHRSCQRNASGRPRSGPSSRTNSSTVPRSTWTAPRPEPPASASAAWILATTAPGAIMHCSSHWPTRVRR